MNKQESMLLVLPWSPDLPGGVSVVVRNLVRVWSAAGVPARILVSDWASKRVAADARGTLSLKLAIFGNLSPIGLLKSLVFAPLTLWRILGLLKAQRVAAVYFHYANLDAVGVALLKHAGLYQGRMVLCFHGTDVRAPAGRIEAILWNAVFGAADAIVACSNSLARGVEQTYSLAPGRVGTIYNGVDTAIFSQDSEAAAPDLFGPGIERYVVSVGSFIERKGHRFLIDAFARVAGSFPGLGLVIVGMEGNQRSVLEAQARALGIGDAVRFLVNLRPAQVAEVVAGAVLCVQPSLAEPFGMAVIEAGASGVCVAASAVGGHTELIAHGQTGFLFKAADAQAIEQVLLAGLQDDALRARLAAAFRARVLSEFSWETCAGRYQAYGLGQPGALPAATEVA